MALTNADIQHIATLAQLELDAEAAAEMTDKLGRIVAFVDQLQAVDLANVEPMAHPLSLTSRLRADVVTESIDRERFQADATEVSDGMYLVPKVID